MNLSVITDQVDQDIEKALPLIQAHGYSYVELHNVFGKTIETIDKDECACLKTLLQKYQLKVSCIASTVFFLCPLYPNDVVSSFDPTFKAVTGNLDTHLSYLLKACRIAKTLDCDVVRVFPFRFPDNRRPPYGTVEDVSQILRAMSRALQIAQAEDVTLVLENCPHSHLPKGFMTAEIVQFINNPHLQLLWDPGNSYRAIRENLPQPEIRSIYDEWDEIKSYVRHVHIKDYHYDPHFEKPYRHVPLGQGDLNYKVLMNKMRDFPYCVSLEAEVDQAGTLASMQVLKTLWEADR